MSMPWKLPRTVSEELLPKDGVQRTVIVAGVSMHEQAVLSTCPPDLESVEVQDFHLAGWVFSLFTFPATGAPFEAVVTVTMVVAVL